MGYLKTVVKKSLEDSISKKETEIKNLNNSLEELGKTNMKNASYLVHLRSLWEGEGQSSVKVGYEGNLKGAIESAEEEFRRENNTDDIQADYSVEIQLGEIFAPIPTEYWKNSKS